MTTAVQRRRGTTTEHTTFTGLEGEISVNTTKETLVVHDGSTAGGFELARADGSNFIASSVDINGGTIDGTTIGASSASTGAFTSLSASGEIVANGGIALGDNDKATFGAGDDLQIYHDGVTSVIEETGSGDLRLKGTNIDFKSTANETYAYFQADGASILYHNGSTKLATTSTGIDVTGTAKMDGLTVDGDGLIQAITGAKLEIKSTTNFISPNDVVGSLDFVSADYNHAAQPIKGQLRSVATHPSGTGDSALFLSTTETTNLKDRIKVDYNGDISFYEDTGTTAKFFWDASAESLGIGTTSPYGLTHWQDSSTINLIATNSGADGQANTTVMSLIGQARSYGNNIAKLASIDFKTDATSWFKGNITFNVASADGTDPASTPLEAMRIDSAGNVGIGNSSPASLSWPNGSTGGLHLQAGAMLSAYNAGTNLSQNWYYNGGEKFIGNGAASRYVQAGAEHIFSSAAVNSSGAGASLSWLERMRIDSAGNVGIGTSAPAARLDLGTSTGQKLLMYADSNIKYGMSIEPSEYRMFAEDQAALTFGHMARSNGTTYTERMRIDTSGIDVTGTVVADALTVDSNGELIELNYANDGGSALIAWKSSAGATLWDIGGGVVAAQDEFAIRRAGSAKFIIKSDGNVGIGTNSPATALSVVGDITTTGGVYLGGTGAANKLDDYEEGTFTPAITFGGASVGLTYTAARGRYTKVGRLVTVQIGIDINNKGTSTGDMNVTGLPFGTATFSGGYGGQLGAMRVEGGWTGLTGAMIPFIDENGATLIVIRQGTSTGTNPVTDANTTSGYFFIAATYMSA